VAKAPASQRRIALLRGINVGSHRRIGMADLRKLLEGHGYADVRTHLQSGNVVLTSSLPADRLGKKLERELDRGLGFEVEVIVRTRAELARVVAGNPFAEVAKDPSRYLVTFLRAKPAAKLVRELRALDVAPEQVAVSGREVYSWHPDGLQSSQLAKLLAKTGVSGAGTNRNWRTVTKLLELADEDAA
jgi:uncharacterized protein (DUF1697 family)